jgi:hypothetical protein
MAKGSKKAKKPTKAEAEQIEKDRLEAHAREGINEALEEVERSYEPVVGPNVQVGEFVDQPDQGEPTENGEQTEGQLAEGEKEPEEKEIVSVVAPKYKDSYIANAKANGIAGKAARRSNWDWLAQQLAKACLGEKESIDIGKFIAVLEVNGVDYSKWTNRNRGWEGRFRMTGRVVLQKVVADRGSLLLPEGVVVEAPEEWRERFKTKKAAPKAAAVVAAVKEEVVDSQF